MATSTHGTCVDLYREKAHDIATHRQDLNAVDIVVLLVYFALVLIVGFAVSVQINIQVAQGGTTEPPYPNLN